MTTADIALHYYKPEIIKKQRITGRGAFSENYFVTLKKRNQKEKKDLTNETKKSAVESKDSSNESEELFYKIVTTQYFTQWKFPISESERFLIREVCNLVFCKHPAVIELVYWYLDKETGGDHLKLHLFMEEGEENLTAYIEYHQDEIENSEIDSQLGIIAYGIVSGLSYMNINCDVMNRDVKTDNIILKKGEPKIIDFGLSKEVDEKQNQRMTGGGTKFYLINDSIADDIYAVCMVLLQLYCGIAYGNNEAKKRYFYASVNDISHHFSKEKQKLIETFRKIANIQEKYRKGDIEMKNLKSEHALGAWENLRNSIFEYHKNDQAFNNYCQKILKADADLTDRGFSMGSDSKEFVRMILGDCESLFHFQKKALNEGDPSAFYFLAFAYEHGIIFHKNKYIAYQLYNKSGEKGVESKERLFENLKDENELIQIAQDDDSDEALYYLSHIVNDRKYKKDILLYLSEGDYYDAMIDINVVSGISDEDKKKYLRKAAFLGSRLAKYFLLTSNEN